MELKFKFKYIYRGRETDLVNGEIMAAKLKNRYAAPNKLKKKWGAS